MKEMKTPAWLIETQNKSWEPEILISGITLTFLFILTNRIYNFFAMLIQDHGVWTSIGRNSFIISIILLTGFKVIFITHLILRGAWTGLVGLSYVFPKGVNMNNVLKSQKNIEYKRPDTLVIQLEKVCSLLFAFIFSTFIFVIGFLILYIPIIILFITGLDLYYVRIIMIYVLLPIVFIVGLVMSYFERIKKDSKIKKKSANFFFTNLQEIFLSNIGRKKMGLIFVSYFLVVGLLAFPTIAKFKFDNSTGTEVPYKYEILDLDYDHYEKLRDPELRIPKATINQFRISSGSIELFISFYKHDLYTLKKMKSGDNVLKKTASEDALNLVSLYDLYIDAEKISGLTWYSINNRYTNQKGIVTSIPVDKLECGYHELKISKKVWRIGKDVMKQVDNWEIIPFEVDRRTVQ